MDKRKRRQRPKRDERPSAAPGGTRLWLYGVHAVRAALDNPRRQNHRLLVTAEVSRALPPLAPGAPRPEVVERGDLAAQLPDGAVHQGLALLTEDLPSPDLDTVCAFPPEEAPVVLVLDQVTDPRNVGAILRSAAAFGARAVIVTRRHAPPTTGVLAKAASGALETVPLVRVANLARALDDLSDMGYWRLGLDPAAPKTLAGLGLSGPLAVVLGAEGSGLRRLTETRCDYVARLPLAPGGVESLNVSAAAAIALYELARNRPDA